MSGQNLCARMSGHLSQYQKSCKDISRIQGINGGQGQPLVNSPKLACDFDNFASNFAQKHKLTYVNSSNKKISKCLCSVDAIILDNFNDNIILVEFKYDKVGHPEKNKNSEECHFVYEMPKSESDRNYELWIYRKFTESLIMLITDCGLEFKECAAKVQGLLVLNARDNQLCYNTKNTNIGHSKHNHFKQMSNAVRGSNRRELHTLKELEGVLFSSVRVLSETAFDKLFPNP